MIYYQIKPKQVKKNILSFDYLPEDYKEIIFKDGLNAITKTLQIESITDYFHEPFPIISEEFLNTINIYTKTPPKKFVTVSSSQLERDLFYWAVKPRGVDCLHPETIFDNQGIVETLVLKKERIIYEKFFSVQGLPEDCWIVSLDVMESLLRRGLNGFVGEEVRLEE
ncbi:hypothetical protein [Candidatus Enterococcus clewellii]|uniref:Uncharacterized protein n=1 Tax=Candidatus Enterococcus clewellii TaxID=1834193 RepID=A0A242KDI8_9ENTE|nr:hypothetical protein [Enterococcus sp. 9E7_DIV0242]OTP19026.1 hypothetical protein A5888_000840 [Enterococcus sp. 9E7_DIV0242]